jgi:SNF2 family DNA or RNA helicase
VTAGPWLAQKLQALRASDGAHADPGSALKGVLRPYQRAGVRWMQLLCELGLGACLADDMGLGKTIQVLSLLLLQAGKHQEKQPSLLVVPASLLANWAPSNKATPMGLPSSSIQHRDSRVLDTLGLPP